MPKVLRTGLLPLFLLFLAPGIYAQDNAAKAYLVSNAHLDSQWNWDVQTTISQYIPKTLFRNLTLIDKYPDYVFNCEAGIKYSWMKEYYPEDFERLREAVAAGELERAQRWQRVRQPARWRGSWVLCRNRF